MKEFLKKLLNHLGLYPSVMRAYSNLDFRLKKNSSSFWESLYQKGGTSGPGSYGKLAVFKAEVINEFCEKHKINSVIEWGCGDGNQLSLMNFPKYIGLDVSETAIKRCKEMYAEDDTKSFFLINDELSMAEPADLTLSLDVIYHLVEDEIYEKYMSNLFASSKKYVCIYASNYDTEQVGHVRHREFIPFIKERYPRFKLLNHIPNRYPYDSASENETSVSDFFFFELSLI